MNKYFECMYEQARENHNKNREEMDRCVAEGRQWEYSNELPCPFCAASNQEYLWRLRHRDYKSRDYRYTLLTTCHLCPHYFCVKSAPVYLNCIDKGREVWKKWAG